MCTSCLVLLSYHSQEKPTYGKNYRKKGIFSIDLRTRSRIAVSNTCSCMFTIIIVINMLLPTIVFSISLTTFLNVMHTKKFEY